MICTLCKRDLPETEFFPSFLRRKQHQCRKCCYEKYNKKAQKKYMDSIKKYPEKDFETFFGGYTITILNYSKKSEYRYTIKSTKSILLQTNDTEQFMAEVSKIISQCTQ